MEQNDEKTQPQDRPLPGHETQSDEMACPACGRFVGAATKCPYCGAKVAKRMSLVALRWAAVLLSTVGLVLLWLMAKTREPELIKIGDIETTMNFGVVRLVGEVRNDPRPFKNGNGMSFNVSDGTGSIIVFVDQTQRQDMIDAGIVPRWGDGIDFVAQLQAASSGHSARIRSLNPDSFKLERGGAPVRAAPAAGGEGPAPVAAAVPTAPAPARDPGTAVPFSAIDESLVGQTIALEGTVTAIKEPDPGTKQPYVVTIGDGAGTLDLKVWSDQYLQIPDPASLTGTPVRVKAVVKRWKDQVDLQLRKGSDLQRAAPPAVAKPIAEVTAALAGRTVTVRGSVVEVAPPRNEKAPWTVTLADPASGAKVAVVYWDAARAAFARQPVAGDVFEFTGKVDVYAGATQVKVASGDKARFVPAGGELPAPAPAAAPAAPIRRLAVPVAEITAASDGWYATVEGALSAPSDLEGKGTSYQLADDTGSIVVVLWNTAFPADLRQKAAAAKRVRVNGKVKNYKGALEIIPGASGLEILE